MIGQLGGDLPEDNAFDPGGGGSDAGRADSEITGQSSYSGRTSVQNEVEPGLVSGNRAEYPVPPGGCILYHFPMTQAELAAFGGSAPTDTQAILGSLSAIHLRAVNQALSAWRSKYPLAPPANVRIGATNNLGGLNVYVVRPPTQWDPILDKYPVYPPHTDQADAFNAGLRLFFPDFCLDPLTGADLRGGNAGSLTVYGPFPVTEKFVTPQMVALAVQVAKMPGAFQIGAVGGSSRPDLMGSLTVGLKATAASGGNYWVGLGAAASKFIIGAFDWLFGSDPQPPAWLQTLQGEKLLREGPGGSPSFAGVYAGAGAFQRTITCPRVTINARGTMTIEQGYQAWLTELGIGSASGGIPWLLLGAGALGLYFLTE